jgi:hypothetical protein
LRIGPRAADTSETKSQKFFGSFFQKRTLLLNLLFRILTHTAKAHALLNPSWHQPSLGKYSLCAADGCSQPLLPSSCAPSALSSHQPERHNRGSAPVLPPHGAGPSPKGHAPDRPGRLSWSRAWSRGSAPVQAPPAGTFEREWNDAP